MSTKIKEFEKFPLWLPPEGEKNDILTKSILSPDSHSLIFENLATGNHYSFWKSITKHKGNYGESLSLIQLTRIATKCAVMMCHGGYFAGACFDKSRVLLHKTFHRYVVRKKQGNRQANKDGTGVHPKSAGAHLRRYNEEKHESEVIELLKSRDWSEFLRTADVIVLHAPGMNRNYFMGEGCALSKDDPRVISIPFVTSRPSFEEVKRVHKELTSVRVKRRIAGDAVTTQGDSETVPHAPDGCKGGPSCPAHSSSSATTSTTNDSSYCGSSNHSNSIFGDFCSDSETEFGLSKISLAGKAKKSSSPRSGKTQQGVGKMKIAEEHTMEGEGGQVIDSDTEYHFDHFLKDRESAVLGD